MPKASSYSIASMAGAFMVFVVLLFSAPLGAKDVAQLMQLPDYTEWCSAIVMADDDASKEDKQKAARAAVLAIMDKELDRIQSATTGLPYWRNVVTSVTVAADGSTTNAVSWEVCYTVDPSKAVPTANGIVRRAVKGEKIAALVCARSAEDECIKRLKEALLDATPALTQTKVDSFSWRYTATGTVPANSIEIADTLTTFTLRPIHGDATVNVSGDISIPDPKKMRPLTISRTGSVITVPVGQGQWYVVAIEVRE